MTGESAEEVDKTGWGREGTEGKTDVGPRSAISKKKERKRRGRWHAALEIVAWSTGISARNNAQRTRVVEFNKSFESPANQERSRMSRIQLSREVSLPAWKATGGGKRGAWRGTSGALVNRVHRQGSVSPGPPRQPADFMHLARPFSGIKSNGQNHPFVWSALP
ncbi:hypothetical protein BT67DRAFT_98001 [Trichocladium antarcticum]|uniref:Uncharacterized protein n=1 Tax=Trichocladium antarcticum TaxID=1450529 RepID=A0AAN6UQP5_9PEZI|nr:hypothetical protein BT67DRAFT_98001 [Trichocladium antarcticum]